MVFEVQGGLRRGCRQADGYGVRKGQFEQVDLG